MTSSPQFLYADTVRQSSGFKYVSWSALIEAANKPYNLAKNDAPVIAAHDAPAKTKAAALEHNQFGLAWADLDGTKLTIQEVDQKLADVGIQARVVHTTASHDGNGSGNRFRPLVPLSEPVSFEVWHSLQYELMEMLGGDECALRCQQIMFLPVAGEHYESIVTEGKPLDPNDNSIRFIDNARKSKVQRDLANLAEQHAREAAEAAREAQVAEPDGEAANDDAPADSDAKAVIEAFNKRWPLGRLLKSYGYKTPAEHKQDTDKWINPESVSGSPGVFVDSDKMWSENTSDPCADGKQHDSFDVFRIRTHNGDWRRALADAAQKLGMKREKAANDEAEPVSNDQRNPEQAPAPEPHPFVFADEFSIPDETPMLIDGYLAERGVNILFAPKDHFKSFVVVGQLCSVAAGLPWQGFETRQGPVLYIAGEGNKGLERRIIGWCLHHQVDHKTLPLATVKFPMQVLNDVDMVKWHNWIEEHFVPRFGKPVAVAVDTLATNFGDGDENSPTDTARFIANLMRYIEAPFGCSVAVVHHTGHKNETRARGGTPLEQNAEEVYYLRRPDEANRPMEVELVVKHSKDRDRPPPLLLEARVQELGKNDREGDPMTTLVMKRTLSFVEQQVLRLMKRGESIRQIASSMAATWQPSAGDAPPTKSAIGRMAKKLKQQGWMSE